MTTGVSSYAIAALLCSQTVIACLVSTVGQYVYGFYVQSYPGPSNRTGNETTIRSVWVFYAFDGEENRCAMNSSAVLDGDAQAWAQQRSAHLFFWTNLCSSCPVIVMTYLFGLYTSRLGRRVVLIVPMLGMVSQCAIWLAIINFHLAEFWWYIAAVVIGLSGSGTVLGREAYRIEDHFSIEQHSRVLGLTLTLIITDSTIENERSSRFVRLGAMQTALSAVTTLSIGYYIGWRGFTDLYWSTLVLQLIAIGIVLLKFRLVDSNRDERTSLLAASQQDDESVSSTGCGHFFAICTVFRFSRRSKKKSISLLLTLFANFFFILAANGFAPLLWFLLNAPFCWTSKDLGNYSALGAISSAVLSLLGMEVLSKVGASDALICVMSHAFFCASALWTAFARYSWQLYLGLFISAFSGYQGTLTASMMSKCLESNERTHAFTFVTGMNTIVSAFANSLFNWVYARTVVNHRNLTMLLAAGLGVVPLCLNM